MSGHSYTETIAQAFAEVKAWKVATLIFAAVTCVLAFALVKKSLQETIILIPHEIASAKGHIKLDTASKMMNPDYLQYLAIADLNLLLNWTPASVKNQYARFLNRTSADLYSAQNVKLIQDAETFSKSATSQAFYPEGNVKVNEKGLVRIEGLVVRWTGEKEVLRYKAAYLVQYKESGSTLLIDNVKLDGNDK